MLKNIDKARSLAQQFMTTSEQYSKSSSKRLQKIGRAITVAAALTTTAACVAPPSGPDRPSNSNSRVFNSVVSGGIVGGAIANGDTKDNIVGALIGAAIAGTVAYSNNQRNEARIQALRDAGIQTIELPYKNSWRDETRVLMQFHPEAAHRPGAGERANMPFINSMIAIANAVDMYPIDSYRDVEVLYVMPEGCSQEVRNNAHELQMWLHRDLNLPVGVSPMLTRDGGLTYNDVVSEIGGRSQSVFSNRTQNQSNFDVDRDADCSPYAQGHVNVVVNNIKR